MVIKPPAFRRLGQTSLYQLPRAGSDRAWCGYLADGTELPDSISVEDSFLGHTGHYLFALAPPPLATPEDIDSFMAEARSWLADFVTEGYRACAWLPVPAHPRTGPDAWTRRAFVFVKEDLDQNTRTLYSKLESALTDKIGITVPDYTKLSVSSAGLTLTKGTYANPISFTHQSNHRLVIDPPAALIPFFGQHSGTLLVRGTLRPSTTLRFCETGLRYAHPGAKDSIRTQLYPVLDTGSAPLPLSYAASVDILDPFNESLATVDVAKGLLRTQFAVLPGTDTGLPSYLRTVTGKTVALIPTGGADAQGEPRANAAGFAFERTDPAAPAVDPYIARPGYLSYCGDWEMAVPDTGGAHELLCGIYGLERLTFRARTADGNAVADKLRFVPGQPAFAARFPYQETSVEQPVSLDPPLTDALRTSYATIVSGDSAAVEYRAQPESGPLYGGTGSAPPAGTPSTLDFLDVGSPLPTSPGFALPFAPPAGVADNDAPEDLRFTRDELGPFESRVLAVARKAGLRPTVLARLRAEAHAADGAGPKGVTTTGTTPQGFLVTLNGSHYQTVTMGRTALPDFAFHQPDAELVCLLQTNQLFAVAANPVHLGTLAGGKPAPPNSAAFQNAVDIGGWRMTANVGARSSASDYRNVLIFKFCDGTLRDRVANPEMWTDPQDFSVLADRSDRQTALTGLSGWLIRYIDDAVREADADNPLYVDFAQLATDPTWKGVLVLRADVDPAGLPAQIRGLAAGIDFSEFSAHHFGITVTPVTSAGGRVEISGQSCAFGLIDYQLPEFRRNVALGGSPDVPLPLPVTGDYGFTVLQLQALFRNAALVQFESRTQVTVNRLFGSAVAATYGPAGRQPANAVVLRGSFQQQGDQSTYAVEQDTPSVFALDSNILPTVGVERVQFNTLTTDAADERGELRSRILFSGTLAFAELTDRAQHPFDVLSFGPTPAADTPTAAPDPSGLAFANLQIGLASPAATPNAVTFTFTAEELAFNLPTSTVRPGSLFAAFGLQLEGFITAPDGKRPSDYGYLPVTTGVPADELKGPWYGLTYKVTMGTPGALVAQAGFTSRMLVAWSPTTRREDGKDQYAAFAGLQLPGAAPGAKLFSLQGILKLSIGRLELLYEPIAGGGQKAFALKLSNVGLSFLGIAKLPPGVAINFFLFGDPAGRGALGWYAAYIKGQKELNPERQQS